MNGWTIAFWLAVVLLVDAGIGLLGESRWSRLAPNVPIRAIAISEGLLAIVLIAAWFLNRG